VAIKKVVDEFGAALWLDPELQLNMQLTDTLQLSRMDLWQFLLP